MKIGIIGTGNVGKALGTSLTRAGHDITFAASTPASAQAAAAEIGATAADSPSAAASGAEITILAVPYVDAGGAVASEIADAVKGRIVVDATNPIKPDYSGLAISGSSAAEEFQRRLPEASVVKAFNTLFATHQANPSKEIDGYVAGDNADAKAKVMDLVDSMGFTPVDVGPLSAARTLEGMAYLNIGLNAANGWSWTSSWHLKR
jgi:predicted dinucleotide-binding enzyme